MRHARLLILSAAFGAGAPAAAQTPDREWKTTRTAHVTVVGNARAEDLQRLGRDVERFREAFTMLSPAIRLDDSAPTYVVVLRDDAAMRPYKPRSRGTRVDAADSFFAAGAEASYIVLTATDAAPAGPGRPPQPRGTLTRFGYQSAWRGYAAELARQSLRRAPAWLTSGLVDFYGTFDAHASDGRTWIGNLPRSHARALTEFSLLPVADLLADDSGISLRKDEDSRSRFAATAWVLTHYLIVGRGGALHPKLATFLQAVEGGAPVGDTFRGVFGDDLPAIDQQLREHLRLRILPILVLKPEGVASPAPVTPLSEADALALRAELTVRVGAYEDAETLIAQALTHEPGHARARLARARSRHLQGNAAGALAILDEPDLAADERLEVLVLRADVLRDAERFADAVTVYRRAAALRPTAASVHYGMILAMMGAGDPEAVAAFSRCLTLRPGAGWFQARQRQALRLGLDTYVASDAINWVRLNGWSEDASYMMLAKAFTELRQKKAEDAATTLALIASHNRPGDWVSTVGAFLRGELTADAFVAKADDDGQRTEAHAYAGIKANIDGDRDAARTHLAWVQTRGRKDFIEYGYALGELRRLARAEAAR